jgi:hypothetical protein
LDDIQTKLLEMITAHPQCITNRQKLKSLLADYLPSNKREINLLLSAYDEELHKKLASQQDTTLFALRSIKQLRDDYGMTEDAAFWTVESWCYLLGMDIIANALAAIRPTAIETNMKDDCPLSDESECVIGIGVYKAGVDIPVGEISIQLKKGKRTPKYSFFLNTGNNTEANDQKQVASFIDKAYIVMRTGQYLKVWTMNEGEYQFVVRSMQKGV